MQFDHVILLSDELTRGMFEFIAKRRKAIYKDIRSTVEMTVKDDSLAPEQIDGRLEKLKSAGLIEEQPSPITDFDTYYITAEGLSAERKLRQRAAAA